jgi:hypothetical protein
MAMEPLKYTSNTKLYLCINYKPGYRSISGWGGKSGQRRAMYR